MADDDDIDDDPILNPPKSDNQRLVGDDEVWPPAVSLSYNLLLLTFDDKIDLPYALVGAATNALVAYLKGFEHQCIMNITPLAASNLGMSSMPGDLTIIKEIS